MLFKDFIWSSPISMVIYLLSTENKQQSDAVDIIDLIVLCTDSSNSLYRRVELAKKSPLRGTKKMRSKIHCIDSL